jgi:hypothetical protein
MVVGIMVVRLRLAEASSLKDKRHTVKSLINRAKSRYGVAAAEVDDQDTWQRARLSFAAVANTEFQTRRVLSSLENDISRQNTVEIFDTRLKFVGLDDE